MRFEDHAATAARRLAGKIASEQPCAAAIINGKQYAEEGADPVVVIVAVGAAAHQMLGYIHEKSAGTPEYEAVPVDREKRN